MRAARPSPPDDLRAGERQEIPQGALALCGIFLLRSLCVALVSCLLDAPEKSLRIKQTDLFFLWLKCPEIAKHIVRFVEDVVLLASAPEDLHEFAVVWTVAAVGVAKRANILLLDAGEIAIGFPRCR